MTQLSLHTIKPAVGSTKRVKRLGRGHGSGKGTYSARGLKGQRSRSGGRSGLKLKGLKSRLQKIPKLRGFHSPYAKATVVNLSDLEKRCQSGEIVTPLRLAQLGLIASRQTPVKILSNGVIKNKLIIKNCAVSKTAQAQIEQAGGSVVQSA